MNSLIERAMKNKVLYTPDQVYGVIMNAKITEMTDYMREI